MKCNGKEQLEIIYEAGSEIAELYREIVGKRSVIVKMESGAHINSRFIDRAEYYKKVLPEQEENLEMKLENLMGIFDGADLHDDVPYARALD